MHLVAAATFLLVAIDPTVGLIAKAKPAVVIIYNPDNAKSVAAGTIISRDGIIVTNHHAVRESRTVKVKFHDGSMVDGDVFYASDKNDIAFVRVKVDKPPVAMSLATREPNVGDKVIAIGHPLGFLYSATTGIISGTGRSITLPHTTLTDLLQTTAPINGGNSGGPLLNSSGEVVGIVCAVNPAANNLAFAISAKTIRDSLKAK